MFFNKKNDGRKQVDKKGVLIKRINLEFGMRRNRKLRIVINT